MNPTRSLLLTCALSGLAIGAPALASSKPDSGPTPETIRADLQHGKQPIAFEANVGQTDAQVRYLSRGPGYSLFLTPAEAVLSLQTAGAHSDASGLAGSLGHDADGQDGRDAVLRLSFDGANRAPAMAAEQRQPGASNYFVGSDASAWRRDRLCTTTWLAA